MVDSLNYGIQQAVKNYQNMHPSDDPHVKFVQEPDTSNNNLYFWHYPYAGSAEASDSSSDPFETVFETAYNKTWNDAGSDVTATYPKYNHFFNAVFDNITPELFQANGISDWNDPEVWGGSLGYRTRVFHPQFNWHSTITTAVLA
ncbi:hypothetical protein LTR66_001411 [Elasticomyces elasticus]|nr:hypothetical protein LTR66_001411 [Elasticomyces elasticus]